MIRKTSAMVEAGILAAVAIVMALISMYVPVLGAFVNFVWPLPIVICGCRHGLKWSIMTLLVATVIIGLILGECMRRHLPPMKMMLYGSVGAVIALVLNIVLSFWVLGIDPIEMMFSSFHQSLEQLTVYYREHGMSEADIKKTVDGYMAAKKILTKLGESFEAFPPFTMLQVPGWILWPYAASLFAVTYYYQHDQASWMYTLSVNVQTVCSFVLVLQGIVLLYWFVETKHKPRWWANIGIALLFIVPIFTQIMVYVGAFDIVMDFRKIRPASRFRKQR